MVFVSSILTLVGVFCLTTVARGEPQLELAGMTVTPHVRAESMRYREEPEPADGARFQLFFKNISLPDNPPVVLDGETSITLNGDTPDNLVAQKRLAWHDFPSAMPDDVIAVPPGGFTVFSFNGRQLPFGAGGEVQLNIGDENTPLYTGALRFSQPGYWISAVTFFVKEDALCPDVIVVHIANECSQPIEILAAKMLLPADSKTPRVMTVEKPLSRVEGFNGLKRIPPHDRGGFVAVTDPIPLTYVILEVLVRRDDGAQESLWAYLRVKPEYFDISGGWVNDRRNPLRSEVFLKTLKRLYVNTAHIAEVPGYTDTDLYGEYPLKYFNALTPFDHYDRDEVLPRIHAVEFLGEPQYGGGRPVPPQEVWKALYGYTKTRLATTVTHSEERIWRDYAGLSDFPHYDAYRVSAPSADAWRKYDRWGEKRIGWGAPLETIGDMCRSLRELNRPMPCAYWSQGPHDGWDVYDRRKRTSPTPDEIRLQAYHALSTRITSLYWFNLSLDALVMWRDTLDEISRIGREIRLFDDLLLEGDAYRHARLSRSDGTLDWDIASVCGPRGAVLFALDLDYYPDPKQRVFVFREPRAATWRFTLPAYLDTIADVFRVDADGVYDVTHTVNNKVVTIKDVRNKVGIYIAAAQPDLRSVIEKRLERLLEEERALNFDPAHNDVVFEALRQLAKGRKR